MITLVAVASMALASSIEYREIPEYGGFFPVEHAKRSHGVDRAPWVPLRTVRGDWVLPTAGEDPHPAYHPPRTPEEAKDRAREYRRKGRLLKPLAPLLWLPGIAGAVEYYAHVRPERLEEEKRTALLDFLGTDVSIRIVDEDGKALSGARVHIATYPREVPTYVDAKGLRSFAGQLPVSYIPSADWIAAKVEHLPIYLGTRCECYPAFVLGVMPWQIDLEPVFEHESDAEGNVYLTSLDFARFATFTREAGWHWYREPTPLAVHAIAWSPGYEATGAAAEISEPGTPAPMTLALRPLKAAKEAQQAHRALNQTLLELCGALDYSGQRRDREWHRDELAVRRGIRQLGEILNATGLPDYLRWNAREALGDLSRAAFAITAPLAAEAEEVLEGSEASWTVAWRGHGDVASPWQLSARTARWFEDIRDGLEPHRRLSSSQKLGLRIEGIPEGYLYPHGPVTVDPVADARALISRYRKLDPGHPSIEVFRAAITLADGKREQAVQHTRFLNHTDFFRLFYPGLGVQAPEVWRDIRP